MTIVMTIIASFILIAWISYSYGHKKGAAAAVQHVHNILDDLYNKSK
jgi:hypothetical protein